MASIGFSACVELGITSIPSRYGDTPEYGNAKLPTSPYLSNRACHGAGASIEFSACVELGITSNSAVQPPVTEIRQNMEMQTAHISVSQQPCMPPELAMASIEFSACVELDITSDSAATSRYGDTPEYGNAKLPTSPYLSNRACHGAGDMASIEFSACVELDITSNSAVQPPYGDTRYGDTPEYASIEMC